jgi:tRNA-Thr(GGU) m(6)t(6)A37 methyltransferase TsaA
MSTESSLSKYSTTAVVCGAAILAMSIEGFLFYYFYNKSKANLADMMAKRNEERSGRIVAQQKLRKIIAEENNASGYRIDPIGYIESPYNERRGTPRQPMLVPAAHGRIRFVKQKIQAEHFQELKEFSHVWVTFIFHENTNTDANPTAKIRPPRLFGKKVGCLSTRTPHRPNAIGLSVCQVVGVTSETVELSCLDLMHGTPVLDVKPYLPYDIIPTPTMTSTFVSTLLKYEREVNPAYANSVHTTDAPVVDGCLTTTAFTPAPLIVPDWINDVEPLKPVLFCIEANANLVAMSKARNAKDRFQFCKDVEHAKNFIIQVLSQDIRGLNQGRGSGTHISLEALKAMIDRNLQAAGAGAAAESSSSAAVNDREQSHLVYIHDSDIMEYIAENGLNDKHVIYICKLDIMEIEFITTDNTILVLKVFRNKV